MSAWEKNVRRVTPYVPGEQPREAGFIKLNTNENPYPPSPAVQRALEGAKASELRLYPDPAATDLTEAIADYHRVGREQVFVGVGSDDVLAMSFMTFFQGEKPILGRTFRHFLRDLSAGSEFSYPGAGLLRQEWGNRHSQSQRAHRIGREQRDHGENRGGQSGICGHCG